VQPATDDIMVGFWYVVGDRCKAIGKKRLKSELKAYYVYSGTPLKGHP
jgi:hypothetical protein